MKNAFLLTIAICAMSWSTNSQTKQAVMHGHDTNEIILLPEQGDALVRIFSPQEEYYDDGVFRFKHVGFSILNETNTLVAKIAASCGSPPQIRLSSGTYFVKLNNCPNTFQFKVEAFRQLDFFIP
jgi:hypothetical protein